MELVSSMIKSKNAAALAAFILSKDLTLTDTNSIVAKSTVSKTESKYQKDFYDQRQLIKKILLNSLYGALGNRGSRFFDNRVAQSVTLSGRCIVKHMASKINSILTGDYNYQGDAIIYGDSVTGDTLIKTSAGEITIEKLYENCIEHCISSGKEYGLWSQDTVIGFDAYNMQPTTGPIEYVMRHKTKKKLYRITTDNNKTVTVSEDHGIMIDRDGLLLEVKPTDIQPGDNIITLV